MVVGWYHSHPGFGCWLSSVDVNTQQSFEQLHPRAVAVVIDPIQSVRGKVVIDAFRSINPQTLMAGQESRQTTSNIGHLNKPSIQALIHGLNRHYYSEFLVDLIVLHRAHRLRRKESPWSDQRVIGIAIDYRKTEAEQGMLLNLHKRGWTEGLKLRDFSEMSESNDKAVKVCSLSWFPTDLHQNVISREQTDDDDL